MPTSGFQGVSVAGVAEAAGVSRQTVYVHFGSREDLVSQAMIRIAQRLMQDIVAQIGTTPDAREYLVEMIVAARAQFRRQPVMAALLLAEQGNPLFEDDTLARVRPVALEFLQPVLERAPELSERLEDVAEMIARSAISVIMFDSAAVHTDEALRGFLQRWLVPVVFAVVATEP